MDAKGKVARQRKKPRRRVGVGPTIEDVAKCAGVSPMTVSRAINNGRVLQATREKVQQAIKLLGYVPNPAARRLAGRKQCRILMLYSNPSSAYLSEILVGSMKGAAASDAQLIIELWIDGESSHELAERHAKNLVDAVLLPPPLCDDAGLIEAFTAYGLRVAQIATGNPSADAIAVIIDDEAAAHYITMHLANLGHRRIGFIVGDTGQSASHRRLAGYKRALRDAGLELDEALIAHGSFTYRSGLDAAEQLLRASPPPTAIFASNDDMAAAVIAVAHSHQFDVPGDLSVCGFDDSAMARSVWPELTTIQHPIAEMASRAAVMLAETIENHTEKDRPRLQMLKFKLIERQSVAEKTRYRRKSHLKRPT